ncbi:unnamed protein product [Litomosoides sigmodontis]|uniref:Uncharacterized protein n=1 Tax=Litomosoides sigmodontis TaxID=42156 RepID=A0A3P6UIC7_LITSI|nr:unnamed protein product [Litomosoides sigmodontis]
MFVTTYFLPTLLLSSIALISLTSAAAYSPRRIVLPNNDEEVQRDMLNDLLQREYADRYREYIERGLAELTNNLGSIDAHSELRPFKRGQTFVRFGKRSQPSVHLAN